MSSHFYRQHYTKMQVTGYRSQVDRKMFISDASATMARPPRPRCVYGDSLTLVTFTRYRIQRELTSMSGDSLVKDQPSQTPEAAPARTPSVSPLASIWNRMKHLSRRVYLSSLAVLLLIALLLVYAFVPSGSAKLRVDCQSNFRSAQLLIIVDGQQMFNGSISGATKKRFVVFSKNASAGFSRTFSVTPGPHTVQVHLSALSEGYDQAKSAYAEFLQGKETVLAITAGRRTPLALNFEGAAPIQLAETQPQSTPHLFSVLISVLGTMLSASISFLMQEFWRSHKASRSS